MNTNTSIDNYDLSTLKPRGKPGRPKALSPEAELKICELLRQGYSAESIAGCFGISAWTVYAIRQRINASSK
jgi:hypothetical protein